MDKDLTSPKEASDVTDEMVTMALDIVEGWYDEGRIDWEDVWDRMERYPLNDGTELDLGEDFSSAALKKIKREVLKARKE